MTVARQYAGELLEREDELAAIAEMVDRASRGGNGVVLVEGEAGVGKTKLLQAVDGIAGQAPVQILHARGGELERSFAFGVARQLIAPTIASLDAGQRAAVLSGAAALAADVADPHAKADSPSVASEDALFARLHGLYWLCADLAAQCPLVLIVDDVHWADDPSVQWLLFLARRLDDIPASLVIAARPATAGDWPEALVLLANEPQVAIVRPQPLTRHGSGAIVRRTLGEDAEEEFCAACHTATGGNPFFLRELIAAVSADGVRPTAEAAAQIQSLAPEGVARSVAVRLGRMPRAARALARAVAVLGAETEVRHAALLAELDSAAAAAAADALRSAGMLDFGRPLRLSHPVLRTAIYSELGDGERAGLHARAARILAGEGADLDAIAAHLLAAEPGGERWRIEAMQQAAERALARGAPRTAAAYLKRALAEPPPVDHRAAVLRALGAAESQVGDPAAEGALREAMRLADTPRQRAEIALELSSAYILTARFGDAIETLEATIEQTADDDQELRWRLEARLIGTAKMETVNRDVVERHLKRLPRDLPGDSAGQRLILAHRASDAVMSGDPLELVVDLATRALGDGQLVAEEPPLSPTLLTTLFALVLCEEHALALNAFDELLTRARREGAPTTFSFVSSMRSQLHYYRGAIPDAIADARSAIDANRYFGWSVGLPSLYANLINPLLEAGDVAGAEEVLASSGLGEEIPEMLLFCDLARSRARLRLAQGNTQAGIDDWLAGHELLGRFGIANPAGMHCRSAAAIALAGLGWDTEARQLVADELAAARRFGAPSTVGISLHAAGVVEGGSAGIDYLREAVDHLERSPARLELARALGDLGAALRRSGKRREAQPLLRQALDLAHRCDAKVVADNARSELLITGARPRRARLAGVEALTASERRVAQLAAQGLTNRQIAQALFVSQPTVVTHLSHCYQKLTISARAQLAGALEETASAKAI